MVGTIFREVLRDLRREGLKQDAQTIEGTLLHEVPSMDVTEMSLRSVPSAHCHGLHVGLLGSCGRAIRGRAAEELFLQEVLALHAVLACYV